MSTCQPATQFADVVRSLGAQEPFGALLRLSPLPTLVLDPQGCVLRWSPAAVALYGWSESEALGQRLSVLAPAENGGAEFASREHAVFEMRQKARDGSLLDVTILRGPIFDASGELAGSVLLVQDCTERKFLERGLIESGERECRRIGQELHDDFCQFLLGAAFAAKALSHDLPPDSAVAADANELARLINSAVQQARDIARGLRLAELEPSALPGALRDLCARPRPGMRCRLECERPVLVRDDTAARHAYRTVEEAVTNAVRHSGGTEVVVRLSEDAHAIELAVSDNGCGFDYASVRRRGLGLAQMEYRARAIGGELRFHTPAEGGAAVILLLPKT